jgi:hypothetical protein
MTITLADTLYVLYTVPASCFIAIQERDFKVYRKDKLDHVLKQVFALTITVSTVDPSLLAKKRKKIIKSVLDRDKTAGTGRFS